MQLELLNKILVFVINASAIIMGAVVYFKNRKGVLNQVFILTIFLMLAWVDFAYAPRVIGHAYPHEALLLLKVAWFITPLFFASLYFLADLLVNGVEFRVMGLFVAIASILDALLVVNGNYVVSGIRFQDVPVSIDYGKGIFVYLGIVTLIIFATIYVIYKQYYYSSKDNRRKLQYFIIGLTIFYIQNIIFNISLPIFFHVSQWYWLGDYSTLVVLVFIAIAIVRHQLFEVKVVLTALVVLVASMLLLLDVALFSNGSTLFVKAFILLLFIVLGVYLVKIEIREIRRREEIQALSTQLAVANKQLKSLDTLKTEFLSIATHQLRTPLTGIKGYISMIADGDFGEVKPEQKKVLDDVLDNTEKLVHLIADFLDISRIERGKLEINRRPTNVEKMVASIVNIFQPNAQEKRVQLVYHPPKNPLPEMQMDEDKFRQVFLNIVDNAVKYTPTGRIDVYLTKKPNSFLFESRDTGVGMNDADKMRLFQRFSRASDAYKTNATGTGLGMYVAKNVVERHGGKIWAESQGRGQGTSFFVEVPFDQSNIKEPELSPEERAAQEASKQTEILSKRLQKI